MLFEAIGTYKICILSDHSSKVYLDDELILDSEAALAFATDVCHNVANAESTLKKIEVECVESTGDSMVELKWITPGTSRQMALPFFHSSLSDKPISQPASQPTLRPCVSGMPSIYPIVSQQPSESLMPSMAAVDVIILIFLMKQIGLSLPAMMKARLVSNQRAQGDFYQPNTVYYIHNILKSVHILQPQNRSR